MAIDQLETGTPNSKAVFEQDRVVESLVSFDYIVTECLEQSLGAARGSVPNLVLYPTVYIMLRNDTYARALGWPKKQPVLGKDT